MTDTNDIGITKLSKYHFYKNEINYFNNYKNDIVSKFGSIENLPVQIKYNIEREKKRLERYAQENFIGEIIEEIICKKNF